MPRLMSVAYTEDAVRERRKTVTRRKGWRFLKEGDRLTLVRKSMGRKPGEPLVRIAEVEVVDVRIQTLGALLAGPFSNPAAYEWAQQEMVREGFPGVSPFDFVETYFEKAQRMTPDDLVTRIEWRYLDAS